MVILVAYIDTRKCGQMSVLTIKTISLLFKLVAFGRSYQTIIVQYVYKNVSYEKLISSMKDTKKEFKTFYIPLTICFQWFNSFEDNLQSKLTNTIDICDSMTKKVSYTGNG